MSFHRENVIWQSADGSWSRGFFTSFDAPGGGDDDFDPEWDVEYDFGSFQWVSTGHATEDAAWASWRGANPGGGNICRYDDGTERDAAESVGYDDMAGALWESSEDRWRCHGTPKRRVPSRIARELGKVMLENASYKIGGYSNLLTDTAPLVSALRERRDGMEPAERVAVASQLEEAADRLDRQMKDAGRPGSWHRAASDRFDLSRRYLEVVAQLRIETAGSATTSMPRSGDAAGPAQRGKTSAASTAGSFAPKVNTAPHGSLR